MNENKVYLSSFKKDTDMETFAAAMEYLREHPYTTLVVESGTYLLTSELARETYEKAMSGEYGEVNQWTMFTPKFPYTRGICFAGQKGTRFEAYGVTLMVDGFMEPVSVRDCQDVEICGFRIDHVKKPYSRGVITEMGALDEKGQCTCVVTLDDDCPVQEGSPKTLRHKSVDPYTLANTRAKVLGVQYVDAHHYKVTYSSNEDLKIGTEFYCCHTYHSRPAILIENALNTKITDVTIQSQPGMGIVGNRSENILVQRLSIVPSIGHHFSTNTDGTHFTSIKGLLRMENCTFDGIGDDFINVHNYYHAVIKREGDTTCWMQEKTPTGTHAQSLDYPDVGDTLELTTVGTMQLIDTYKVLACEPMAEDWMCKVVLDHPLPENTEGLVLADVTRLPRVEVIGCHARCHHARSILIKSRNVLIEGNTMRDVAGAGVYVAPEAWWYEGVAPADVTIRNNRIINCGSTFGGAIMVLASSEQAKGQCIKNIVIEDNIIECPRVPFGISVSNTDGVRIARNQIIARDKAIVIKDSVNVECDSPFSE